MKSDTVRPSSPVRVAVIGGGAIGGVLASSLHRAGHEVLQCVRSPFGELVVEEQAGEHRVPARIVTTPEGLAPVAWVFLTVKAHDTGSTEPWLRALAGSGTTVVVAQNGIDHVERVQPLAPEAEILPALALIAAERVAPGRVRRHFGGALVVPSGRAGSALAAVLDGGGLDVRLASDFTTEAWRKLLSNVAANPITALTLRRMDVFDDPEVRSLAQALVREAAAVGAAAGADVGEQDVRDVFALSGLFTADNGTSMLYDRLAGLPLEHDLINGAVVRTAERLGVPAPLNRTMLTLARAVRADAA
ncbi:2-dehydropantoate 2-reductase [Streptomyces sp. NPDC001380]|uniref:2-dehydropantoate 2-reductase n=1 Tax=Streptomyces sp. NPDC001380 TaxID=3364566 RepID=UPI003677D890